MADTTGEPASPQLSVIEPNAPKGTKTPVETSATIAADPLDGIADMPTVQPHAIEAAATDGGAPPAPAAAPSGPLDKFGRAFDARFHEVEPDGSPRLGKTSGQLCVKRGRGTAAALPGAGGASASVPPVQSIVGNAPETTGDPVAAAPAGNFDPAKIEQCAKVMTSLFFSGGCLVFGDDGQPIVDKATNVDEPKEVYEAFHTYYSIKGAKDIPPGIILAVALVSYGRRRVTLPTVKSRFAGFKEKVTMWWVRLRLRRAAQPRTETVEPETAQDKEAA